MHLPSAIRGDEEVKNCGLALVSLRQTTLPLSASRQETTPAAPSVQTLPSATAGVLRVPGCELAAPVTAEAGYLSFQSSLLLSASRHSVTSSPPCRPKI